MEHEFLRTEHFYGKRIFIVNEGLCTHFYYHSCHHLQANDEATLL